MPSAAVIDLRRFVMKLEPRLGEGRATSKARTKTKKRRIAGRPGLILGQDFGQTLLVDFGVQRDPLKRKGATSPASLDGWVNRRAEKP
jgi:hypothetical protein